MKILVLDDERTFNPSVVNRLYPNISQITGITPFNFLNQNKPEYDFIVYARNYEEAEEVLFAWDWDIVYLDHDLGTEKTGYTLAEKIEEFTYTEDTTLPIGKFIIHSMNPLGRARMYNALQGFYNVEFARVEDLL